MGADTLSTVIEIAEYASGMSKKRLSATSAIDQDIKMYGEDVWDFEEALAAKFGEHVKGWPWQRFACLNEGVSVFWPFAAIWQLMTWPIRGSFAYPSQYERLELGHIAAVLEKGEWFDP